MAFGVPIRDFAPLLMCLIISSSVVGAAAALMRAGVMRRRKRKTWRMGNPEKCMTAKLGAEGILFSCFGVVIV